MSDLSIRMLAGEIFFLLPRWMRLLGFMTIYKNIATFLNLNYDYVHLIKNTSRTKHLQNCPKVFFYLPEDLTKISFEVPIQLHPPMAALNTVPLSALKPAFN